MTEADVERAEARMQARREAGPQGLERVPGGVAVNPSRVDAIQRALLSTARDLYAQSGRESTHTLGQFVVFTNDEHCGNVVQAAVRRMRAEGLEGVRMFGLGWHFVVLDSWADTLYDVEDLGGVPNNKEGIAQLAQGRRMAEVGEVRYAQALRIRQRYAEAWERRVLQLGLEQASG